LQHDRAGLLSMVSFGKDTNSSQFFIILNALLWLDGSQVIFGRCDFKQHYGVKIYYILYQIGEVADDESMQVVRDIEALGTEGGTLQV
jgi:peptidylprolyl isomerase